VSAISSIPSQDGPGSSKISSLSSHGYSRDRKKRGDSSYDRYAVASPGRSRDRGKNRDYDRYAIASTGSNTGDPSALSPTSSRGRSFQSMYTFVNAHGVFGDNNIARNNNKQNLAARGGLNATKKHQSITDSDGNPYFKLDPPTCRRIKAPIYDITDHESLESRNDFSLMGEKFADAGSALVVPNHKANAGVVSTADTAGSGTKWLCDVCKEARFDSYVEAFRHETQCRKIRNERLQFSTKTEKKASTQHKNSKIEFERGINNNKNNRIEITNQNRYNESEGRQWRGEFLENNLHHMSLSSSSDSDTSNQVNITTQSSITNRGQSGNGGGSILHGSVTSRESLRWLCSVCKEVSFNNYEEACNHEKICRIRMEATADMRMPVACIPTQTSRPLSSYPTQTRGDIVSQTTADLQQAAENLKGNSAPLPLLEITESLEDANWQDPEIKPIPEGRQDRNDDREAITSLTRNETMDIIERERERCDPVVDTKEKNKNYTFALPESTIVRGLIPKDKGEAYDRYVNLASQQEEEEERDRLIALARETREEELESDRLGGGDERYVCLA